MFSGQGEIALRIARRDTTLVRPKELDMLERHAIGRAHSRHSIEKAPCNPAPRQGKAKRTRPVLHRADCVHQSLGRVCDQCLLAREL
jgi:hypothetical protein